MRFVAVDWSGAARHEQRHLWLASATGGRIDLLASRTRTGAADQILALAEHDPDLLVGLDFAFSMPAWWLDRLGIGEVAELWEDTALLESWLAECAHPFWGRPGRRRPAMSPQEQWRRTELALLPRPGSVFQLGGAGSVGTGSLRGMPVLLRLRRAGFAIWPFDPPRLPMVAEVWPRLYMGAAVKSRPAIRAAWAGEQGDALSPGQRLAVTDSEDAFDAAVAAIGLGRGDLAPVDAGPVHGREGWIWGVPIPPGEAGAAR